MSVPPGSIAPSQLPDQHRPLTRPNIPHARLQERQYETTVPSVRDRIVQAAMKIVLEPVFEADFLPCSFGFRPKRAAHDGLQVLLDESFHGARWVVETDVADCFGSIPHSELMSAVEERISDRHLLALLRAFLRAGVMEQGTVRRPATGTPQGGVVSPLLANVYLHRLDRAWRGAYGRLVRYADDALVMCRSKGQAQAALARLTVLLGELGLEPKAAKTRIVQLQVGGGGVDFLGFHHRLVRSWPRRGSGGFTYLARWPSRKAMQHARDRIRFLTMRARLAAPVEQIVRRRPRSSRCLWTSRKAAGAPDSSRSRPDATNEIDSGELG